MYESLHMHMPTPHVTLTSFAPFCDIQLTYFDVRNSLTIGMKEGKNKKACHYTEMSAVEEEKKCEEASLNKFDSSSDQNNEALQAALEIIERSKTEKRQKALLYHTARQL